MADPKKRKKKVPLETVDNSVLYDAERSFDSIECLSGEESDGLEGRVQSIMEFEDTCRTPFQVVDFGKEDLGKSGFSQENLLDENPGESKSRKYYFQDLTDGDAMIIVKEGQRPITEGFNIIVAHSDTPCLRIKPKPVIIESEDSEKYKYLGVRLSATAHGGLSLHQWPAQQIQIIGYTQNKGVRRIIEPIPGFIPDYSGHVENREDDAVSDAFDPDYTLEIITGHSAVSKKRQGTGLLERFGFDSIDDFGRAKLFGVPTNKPLPIDEVTWTLLCAYGHDDRICVYSALDAIKKAKNSPLTSILYITDNEEVGDTIPSGINGPFFDHVLDYMTLKHEQKTGEKIDERRRRKILQKSALIYGDVNIAPSGYDADNMDVKNAPKLGLGVQMQLDQESISSQAFADKLIEMAQSGASRGNNICHQVVGNLYLGSQHDTWWYDPHTKGSTLKNLGQHCLNVGVPCALTHSPNEVICPADEFWTSRFYRRFYERNTSD